MNWQLNFYKKGFRKNRVDDEYDWAWLNSRKGWRDKLWPIVGPLVNFVRQRTAPYTLQWLNENSEALWSSRQILEDELSRHLFDCYILLNVSGYQKYYYPRIDFDDFISIQSENIFLSDLPKDYLGIPLKIYIIRLNNVLLTPAISILTTKTNIEALNKYRQYFIKRASFDFSPSLGEVVFDCGACIGDTSLLFAALVGNSGEIHMFDPVPLHIRYCDFQAALNPTLSHTLYINNLAVSDVSNNFSGLKQDAKEITPGGCFVDNFETTSIDDYVSKKNVKRIDYIKMDIEGSEVAALRGSSMILREFKPRLAVSTYHKPDDLWKIPEIIKKLNPKYKIYFGHHSPMNWESVYYAR
jgi:FkbM family methyltransferase